jgi:hypothetical protein
MATPNLRYFDARLEQQREARVEAKLASTTEFLRGREATVTRPPRVYTSLEGVSRQTEIMLAQKSTDYLRQIRAFEATIRFEPFELTRMISGAPHLGYSAITSGHYRRSGQPAVHWVFFFANFDCKFGRGENLFENIPLDYGLSYFALAMKVDAQDRVQGLDSQFGGNGVIFSTADPNEAISNTIRMKKLQSIKMKA